MSDNALRGLGVAKAATIALAGLLAFACCSGAATAGLVYKLVAREDREGQLVDVAKESKDKATVGGRKWAMRRLDGWFAPQLRERP